MLPLPGMFVYGPIRHANTLNGGLSVATWQQVKSYIYANYQVSSDSGDNMSLNFDTGAGRSQMIFIGYLDVGEFSSVLFSSPFAKWGQVPADRILRATEQVHASIRSIGDFIVVSHSQLLASIDESEIDWPITLMVSQADDLERILGVGDQF